MRIRKRSVREGDPHGVRQPLSPVEFGKVRGSGGMGVESGRNELLCETRGEAADVSLVTMAGNVPDSAQEYKRRHDSFGQEWRVPRNCQCGKYDITMRKRKLGIPFNSKIATSLMKCKSVHCSTSLSGSSRIHEKDSDPNSRSTTAEFPPMGSDDVKKLNASGACSTTGEAFDHPSKSSEVSLTHSIWCVFSELPSDVGLSAREIFSKMQERGFSGWIEGDGVPSVQVAKAMRSNPYFVAMRGGKYLLTRTLEGSCETTDESLSTSPTSGFKQGTVKSQRENHHQEDGHDGTTSLSKGQVSKKIASRVDGKSGLLLHNDKIGTRCTRVDGRSWQCRRTSLPGFSLCEHHHLQLSSQSKRQRNFQRAFNQSSRKRLRKEARKGVDTLEESVDTESRRRKGVKALSLEAIVCRTIDVG